MRFPEPSDKWTCPVCGHKGDRSKKEFFIAHRSERHGGVKALRSGDDG